MKCGVGIFLPFEVTGDITLVVFPHPPYFFFLTLFLLMCFSARKNDIRKNTLYRLWKGQKWKPQSEIFVIKKLVFYISLGVKMPSSVFHLFWPHCVSCKILVPWPGIESLPSCSGSTVLTSGIPGKSHHPA